MKTQKKKGQGFYLQKSNNRWKWMAGATTAAAAGVTASQASTITINLINDYISFAGGNHLNADLTGDGHPDFTITGAFAFYNILRRCSSCSPYRSAGAGAHLNGVNAEALSYGEYPANVAILGSQIIGRAGPSSHPVSLMGSILIFFKDLHINGGAPTKGSLEVTVSSGALGDPKVQLDSLTYNAPGHGSRLAAAVPDQGSSLALLAMGAGGILALRRWRAGQERS
jgi:hypothetical protein